MSLLFSVAPLLLCLLALPAPQAAAPGPQSGTPPSQQAATQGRPSPVYTGCIARAGESTVQRGMCAQAELTRQDARLNVAYRALLDALAAQPAAPNGPLPQQTLREEERAWLADRDAVCKLNRDTVDNVCLIERESARADELEARLRRQP